MNVIGECSIVKSAVKLLGGKGKERMEEEEEEGREGGIEEMGGEEERGRRGMIESELKIGEKIKLLELLVTLVKGRVEMEDEEGLMEVVMELEEEANEHVEKEEDEGEEEEEGGEKQEGEKRREKREWEELSERAHELVWVMETRKMGRERRRGKRKEGIEWMEKRKEDEMEKENDEMKKNRIEMERENSRIGGENRGMKEEMDRVKEDNSHMKELCPIITSLDGTTVTIPQSDGIKREGNTIIHHGSKSYRNCFIGGEMTSV